MDSFKDAVSGVKFCFQQAINKRLGVCDPTPIALASASAVLQRTVRLQVPEDSASSRDEFVAECMDWIRVNCPRLSQQSTAYKVWFVFERWLLFLSEQSGEDVHELVDLGVQYCQPSSELLGEFDWGSNTFKHAYVRCLPDVTWVKVLGTNRDRWRKFNDDTLARIPQPGNAIPLFRRAFRTDGLTHYLAGLEVTADDLHTVLDNGPHNMMLTPEEHQMFESCLAEGKTTVT